MGASPGMLRSMTGFGSATVERGGLGLTAELRSVNHRHLVVRVKGPAELAGLDVELEQRIKRSLARGSVTVVLRMDRTGAAGTVAIHEDLLRAYAERLDRLAAELGREPLGLDRLLSLPGVLGGEEDDAGARNEAAHALALEAADAALADLVAMREREGRALAEDLAGHATRLAELVGLVEERMPKVVCEHHLGLHKRLEELLDGTRRVEEQDLARELALLADRLDVSEEVSRLRSHLDQLDELLSAGATGRDGTGRRLDFLIQETLREVNTVGSKCNDATVAHWVVDMKNVVERLREQAANVE